MSEAAQLHKLADDAADQVQLFLGMDERAKRSLVREIKDEPTLIKKYAKLLHVLIDRISTLATSKSSSASIIGDVRERVSVLIPETPTDENSFLEWIPGQMKKYIETIQSFQKRIVTCQSKIEQSMRRLDAEGEKLNRTRELEEKLEQQKSDNEKLREEHERLLSQLESSQKSELRLHERVEVERAEMDEMKEKLAMFSEMIAKLRRQVSKAQFDEDSQSGDSESQGRVDELAKENARLRSELREKAMVEEKLQSKKEKLKKVKMMNAARERRFNEMKAKLTKCANELIVKEKEMQESSISEDESESLRLQIRTISSHLTAERKAKKELEKKLQDLADVRTDNDTKSAHIRLLNDELISLRKELEKVRKERECSDAGNAKANGLLCQKNIEVDSMSVRMNDLEVKYRQLQDEMVQLQKKNKDLLHERIRVETDLTKTKDSLSNANQRLRAFDEDGFTLQRFGFLLADALCQHFNPKNAKFELERLLEVARSEHIELSETARVRLNPLGLSLSNPRAAAPDDFAAVHSQFDELSQQISALQRQT